MNRTNFHTHTERCNHAMGSDEEFVLSAIRNEYKVLGFSDHTCWNYNSRFIPRIRMRLERFKEYKKSILSLKEKYKNQIDIRLGLEAEYFPDYMDWLLDFCIEEEIEYLVFGCHFYRSDENGFYYGYCNRNQLKQYFDDCIKGMETGMYAYLAHPELIMKSLEWDDEIEAGFRRICECAKALDIPLEYNVLGLQMNRRFGKEMYPHSKFWALASEYQNKAIIGMDAHQPSDLNGKLYEDALDYLSNLNVEIIDEIPKIDYMKIKEKKLKKRST